MPQIGITGTWKQGAEGYKPTLPGLLRAAESPFEILRSLE
jgi:hypothetical protein